MPARIDPARYFTRPSGAKCYYGKICPKHPDAGGVRYALNNACVECAIDRKPKREPTMPTARTLREAVLRGSPRYFTGKPCKYGHIAPRWTYSQSCCECKKASSRRRYKERSEELQREFSND